MRLHKLLSEFHLFGAAIILAAGTAVAAARWTLFVTTGTLWYYVATHLAKYG